MADVNGDGRPDLIIGSFTSHTVSVLLGKGDGTFTPITPTQGVSLRNTPYLADLTGAVPVASGQLNLVLSWVEDDG